MIKRIIRYVIAAIAFVFLLWFIAPAFWGIWHIGCWVGIGLCLAVIYRTAFAAHYRKMKQIMRQKKATIILLTIIQAVSILTLLYCTLVSIVMIFAMTPWGVHEDESTESATAVVLGAQVMSWGPSPLLQQRIDAAEKYLNEHPKAVAVVSGGKGAGEPMSEAECMKREMIKDGIDPKRIYPEEQSTNTKENILNSYQVIAENRLNDNIAIVTDSYHQLRAHLYCGASRVHIPVNTACDNVVAIASYPSFFVREWIALPVAAIAS